MENMYKTRIEQMRFQMEEIVKIQKEDIFQKQNEQKKIRRKEIPRRNEIPRTKEIPRRNERKPKSQSKDNGGLQNVILSTQQLRRMGIQVNSIIQGIKSLRYSSLFECDKTTCANFFYNHFRILEIKVTTRDCCSCYCCMLSSFSVNEI